MWIFKEILVYGWIALGFQIDKSDGLTVCILIPTSSARSRTDGRLSPSCNCAVAIPRIIWLHNCMFVVLLLVCVRMGIRRREI